ncbi:hypothetical protein CANCADRAFT_99889 [Tortispora caseinolytica NRRL Y-17796]|uniref:Succinate dehydrogenase assembly factor 2, mitochondrial n=1 Tax=Tortispora caseinolytica NRRL Y-17796 TaxID=767744 RepID=A0A1E4TED2_9ASCO|nr:hypothetical protein CANCADRAFT_99889 [Tortispora caseinolytica NRRL Y-17796]
MLRLLTKRVTLSGVARRPQVCARTATSLSATGEVMPIDRSHETLSAKRARLLYQSRKRGILETDLILSTFAKKHLDSMSAEQLEDYDKLLDEQDWDIYYWITDSSYAKPLPEKWMNNEVFLLLKKHVTSGGNGVLRMPDL